MIRAGSSFKDWDIPPLRLPSGFFILQTVPVQLYVLWIVSNYAIRVYWEEQHVGNIQARLKKANA